MLSDHSKPSFADDESHLVSNKQTWHMSCSSQVASFVKIPRIPPILDEEVEELFSHSLGEGGPVGDSISMLSVTGEQNLWSGMPVTKGHSEEGPGSNYRLTHITRSVDEDVRPEHVKRPPTIDESDKHAHKRVRQGDYSNQQVSFELPPLDADKPIISDAASKDFRNSRNAITLNPSGNAYGRTSRLSWVTCSTFEEESSSELRESLSPCFIEIKQQPDGFVQPEDVCLSILDYHPRKPVALGPDHQADIPAWSPRSIKRLPKEMNPSIYSDHVTNEDDYGKFMGTCIIPMPNFAKVNLEDAKVAVSSSDCSYSDIASIRCVKQHVMEAREKLKKALGENKFIELGFPDMGESVTERWTEEEELAFHEVLSSNPASMGKNFWDHLPLCFPSKSSKDLVSYYFNVFMLRKRAEQNRSDLLDIDSDNDEWQESDDGKLYVEDCEDDSIVESPTDQDDISYSDGHEDDDYEGVDEDTDASDDCDLSQELYDVSRGQISHKLTCFDRAQQACMDLQDVGESHDIQDESCTSYEGHNDGANSIDGPAAAEYGQLEEDYRKLHGGYNNVGLGRVTEAGFLNSPCDGKAWDLSYLCGLEKTVDFLPTCYVIEEVFGKGSWTAGAEDDQGIR